MRINHETRYQRSENYRYQFIKANPKKYYRCVYCNRKIKKDRMQVDHIVPVHAVQTSPKARFYLQMLGCSTVNDIKNLAPSCPRCNKRKGSKMGVWVWKGIMGRHMLYWVFVYIFRILFLAGMLLLAYYLYMNHLH